MAFATAQSRQHSIAEINITPLVDVMLVMLVIFMISAPMLTRTIPLPTSGAGPLPVVAPPQPIELRIDAAGDIFFDSRPVTARALPSLLSAEAERGAQNLPTVKIQVSGDADYEVVAKVLAASQNAGLHKIQLVR
jgi:biopolymer transport protein ExbD